MSILKQVIEEYGISEMPEALTDKTAKRVNSPGGLTDKTDKRASVSSVSDRSEGFETQVADDDELKKTLGDDWDEVFNDAAQLEAARYLVTEAKQVANGIIPERYTQTTDCKFCGPVFVYEGYPQPANNCPWCFNRIKGLPIPKGKI